MLLMPWLLFILHNNEEMLLDEINEEDDVKEKESSYKKLEVLKNEIEEFIFFSSKARDKFWLKSESSF